MMVGRKMKFPFEIVPFRVTWKKNGRVTQNHHKKKNTCSPLVITSLTGIIAQTACRFFSRFHGNPGIPQTPDWLEFFYKLLGVVCVCSSIVGFFFDVPSREHLPHIPLVTVRWENHQKNKLVPAVEGDMWNISLQGIPQIWFAVGVFFF